MRKEGCTRVGLRVPKLEERMLEEGKVKDRGCQGRNCLGKKNAICAEACLGFVLVGVELRVVME